MLQQSCDVHTLSVRGCSRAGHVWVELGLNQLEVFESCFRPSYSCLTVQEGSGQKRWC